MACKPQLKRKMVPRAELPRVRGVRQQRFIVLDSSKMFYRL